MNATRRQNPEVHSLQVEGVRKHVMRRIFGPKKAEVTGELRKIHK
jgi:hypothetical protein